MYGAVFDCADSSPIFVETGDIKNDVLKAVTESGADIVLYNVKEQLDILDTDYTPHIWDAHIAAYLINLIPLKAIVSMALLINMISKSPTLAMLLCIVVYVFFKYLNYYITPVGQMVFTAYSQWHKIWIGNVLPFTALISKIGILFGSILILYTLSYIIFDSKDY